MGAGSSAGDTLLGHAILQGLLYSDVFDYPLTAEEIHRYLPGVAVSRAALTRSLGDHVSTRALVEGGGFYAVRGRDDIIPLRRRRHAIAERRWPRAHRYAGLIAQLPFVRLVAVTGAQAVGNVEVDDDIDLLIVAATGRLWLCRALVITVVRFARVFGDELCPNYLLAEHTLELTERDLFTAREVTQMVPLFGSATYARLRAINAWIETFLPNATSCPAGSRLRDLAPMARVAQRVAERLLRGRVGDRLERWERTRKVARFTARVGGSDSDAIITADCCKGHFDDQRQRIMERFENRIRTPGPAAAPLEARQLVEDPR